MTNPSPFKQATLISATALIGMLFLWLERVYGGGFAFLAYTPEITQPATLFALVVSGLTSPVVVIIAAVGGAIIAGYKHHETLWLLFAGLLTLTGSATLFLKEVFALPRPELAIWDLATFGFPSGHAAVATVALVMVVWFSYHATPDRDHTGVIFWGTFGWAGVCVSRILLGVHSLSDVLAGVLLGVAISSIALAAADTMIEKHWLTLSSRNESK